MSEGVQAHLWRMFWLLLVGSVIILLTTRCVGLRAAFSGYGQDCPTTNPSPPPVQEAVLRASWVSQFGALPHACDAIDQWDVIDMETYTRICSVVDAACTIYPDGCPATFTTAEYADSRLLRAHEWAHWALRCSTGDGDNKHTDAKVWGPAGFVQGYAP